MKAPKIYTRQGDRKQTSLLGGARVGKHSYRIEAIGSLDELNSFLGFLLSFNEYIGWNEKKHEAHELLGKIVEEIQQDLFVIGAELSRRMIQTKSVPHPLNRHYANEAPAASALPKLTPNRIHQIEDWIDHFQANLPPLRNFILPRGNPSAALLQAVRAICRRAERRAVQLAIHSKVNPLILAYLNRLSDLLFVLSRAMNAESHEAEKIWKFRGKEA